MARSDAAPPESADLEDTDGAGVDLDTEGAQLRARFIHNATSTCAAAALFFGVLLFPLLIAPDAPHTTAIFHAGVVATLLCAGGYVASRRGRPRLAALGVVLAASLGPLLAAPSNPLLLCFIPVATIMAALVLSARAMALTVLCTAALPFLPLAYVDGFRALDATVLAGGNLTVALVLLWLRGLSERLFELAATTLVAEREAESLREQLRESRRLESLGQLAGGVAHDFNNYLTVILAGCDLAEHNRDLANVARIRSAAERAARLVGQLLAFARQQPRSPVALDLGAFVRDARELLEHLLREDVELVLDTESEALIVADPSQIEQILINLTANAQQALPTGGRIEVRVRSRRRVGPKGGRAGGEWVGLEIQDDGVGIEPGTMERIFDPFFTTRRLDRGTGLGLATVHGIVSQTGGRIEVHSAPGEGTSFEILFPSAPEEVSLPGRRGDGPAEAAPTPPARILVVDDEDAVREVIHQVLESLGHQVVSTSSPLEALEIAGAQREGFDLAILDVVMPGMGGRELATRLEGRHPGLVTLFVSGHTGSERLPPERLLAKPFSPEELGRRVDGALRGRRQRKPASPKASITA